MWTKQQVSANDGDEADPMCCVICCERVDDGAIAGGEEVGGVPRGFEVLEKLVELEEDVVHGCHC